MFLKNVPPTVVQRTEWRSFDLSKTQSTCFSDSESDVHNSGSSFSGQVQKIIDTLRSSQSSADMSRDFEALRPAGRNVHTAIKKGTQNQKSDSDDSLDNEIEEAIQEHLKKRGIKKEKPVQEQLNKSNSQKKSNNKKQTASNKAFTAESVKEQRQHSDSMKKESQNQSSDSDDSLDREIEEAIQEYLEQRNRKKENPVQVQVTKQLSRDHLKFNLKKNSISRISTTNKVGIRKTIKAKGQHSDSKKKDSQGQSSDNGDSLDREIEEASQDHMEKMGSKAAMHTHHSSLKRKRRPKILTNHSQQANYASASSNNDGTGKKIQTYQPEKQKKKSKKSKSLQPKKESDLSSDDGIEEAIHQYKIEKQKNSTKPTKVPKPPEMNQAKVGTTTKHLSDQSPVSDTQMVRRKRASRKNKIGGLKVASPREDVAYRSSSAAPGYLYPGPSTWVFKESEVPAQSSASLEVNTTAQLMSAEVTPDVSKVVVPAIPANTVAFIASSVPSTPVSSEELTKDSESHSGKTLVSNEGIAQETTEFVELTIQKQSSKKTDTQNFINKVGDTIELLQKKKEASQNNKIRLSLSRKRKLKEVLDIPERSQHENLALSAKNSNSPSDTSSMSAETCIDLDVTLSEDTEPVKTMAESDSPQNREGARSSKSSENLENLNQCDLKSKEFQAARNSTKENASRDRSCSLDGDEALGLSGRHLIVKKMVKINTKNKDKSKKTVRFGDVQMIVPTSEKTTLIEPKSSPGQVPTKSCISKSYIFTVKQNLINSKQSNMILNKSTAAEQKSAEKAKPFVQIKLSVENQAQSNVATLKNVSTEAGEVDNMATPGSVRAGEVNMEPQQAEHHNQQKESFSSGGEKTAVLQMTPSGLQGCYVFLGRPIATSTTSLESHQLKVAEVKEQKVTKDLEKSSPLVTGRKIKKRRLVDHINPSSHKNTVAATKEVFPLSPGQIILNKNSAVSTSVGVVEQKLDTRQPCIIHSLPAQSPVPAKHVSCTKFPTVEVYHSNAVNTDQYSMEPHTNASMPHSTQTPSFIRTRMREGSQGRFSVSSLAETVVRGEKNIAVAADLSTHSNSSMQIRNTDLHLTDKTRGHKGEGQELKAEEGDLYTTEEAEYLDETDYSSDGRGGSSQSSEKRKRPRKMSLSTSIDPGVTISPYIILETPQRYQKYMKSRKLVFTEQEQTSKMLPATFLHQNAKREEQKISSYIRSRKTNHQRDLHLSHYGIKSSFSGSFLGTFSLRLGSSVL